MAAAERLIPFSLELGGKNPMIVLKEAPLEQAAAALLPAPFPTRARRALQSSVSILRHLFLTALRSLWRTVPARSRWVGHNLSIWTWAA